jgi:hypothetical protein
MYKTRNPQAIRRFEDHYEKPFYRSSYKTQWTSMQGPELDRFCAYQGFSRVAEGRLFHVNMHNLG